MGVQMTCRLCGGGFERSGQGGAWRYCAKCRAWATKQSSKVLRVRCKECGKAFSTRKRSVRYCSGECRRLGDLRLNRASEARIRQAASSSSPASASASARAAGGGGRAGRGGERSPVAKSSTRAAAGGGGRAGRGGTAQVHRCRECGKKFVPDWKPGKPHAYCSEGCRTDGRRRLYREARQRYRADPEKRAIQAARDNASAVRRRRARKKEER